MTRPVVAGVDGSPQSIAAARWAAREAVRRGAPLRLLHAWPWLPHLYSGAPSPDALQAESLLMLAGAQTNIQADFPQLSVETEMLTYSTIDGLIAAGDEVALMVLGSRGMGGFEGLLVGSNSLAAASRSTCPVVLVRAGETPEDDSLPGSTTQDGAPMRRSVVLGLDAHHPSDALIDFAVQTAARRDARLQVVHTWSRPAQWSANPIRLGAFERAQMQDQESQALREALRGWSDKYPDVDIRSEALLGSAAKILVDRAQQAGMLIVGRHIRRAALGMHLGRVAHAVLHHAACPVAVVPHE